MFSAVEIAWFSAIPAVIAALVVWMTTGQTPTVAKSTGSDEDSPALMQGGLAGRFGLAIVIATAAAMLSIQAQDHHDVLVSNGSADDSAEASSLWIQAVAKAATDFAKPKVAHHWTLIIAIGGLVAGKFVASGAASFLRLVVAVAVCAAVVLRLLWTSVYLRSEWSTTEQVAWIGGVSLLSGWAWWMAVKRINDSNQTGEGDLATRDSSAYQRLLLFGAATSLMAAALIFTGSLRYGVIAAIVASAAGGSWIAGWRVRNSRIAAGWCGPMILLMLSLLIAGTAFSELPFVHAMLFAATILFASVTPFSTSDRLWKKFGWILIGILPAVVAAAWAFTIFADTFNNAPVNPYDAYK